MKGRVYVFLRKDGAPLPPGCAGHTGWGIGLDDGRTYGGATENSGGHPFIAPRGDNGWWSILGTEPELFDAMRARDYDAFKVATCREAAPAAGRQAADATRDAGYRAIGDNCLDHTYRVLKAYGVKDLPWPMNHPSPNDWFALVNGEYHDL